MQPQCVFRMTAFVAWAHEPILLGSNWPGRAQSCLQDTGANKVLGVDIRAYRSRGSVPSASVHTTKAEVWGIMTVPDGLRAALQT
eukprot:365423-Chlamydomonas_euryale.AAC.4